MSLLPADKQMTRSHCARMCERRRFQFGMVNSGTRNVSITHKVLLQPWTGLLRILAAGPASGTIMVLLPLCSTCDTQGRRDRAWHIAHGPSTHVKPSVQGLRSACSAQGHSI